MSESDITKMKVADLKKELKSRGLSTNGNKTELQERLQTALLDGDGDIGDSVLEDSVISDEMLDDEGLIDDDLDDDETKSLLESGEEALLKSPTTLKDIDLKPSETNSTKKVTLKRNISTISSLSDNTSCIEKPSVVTASAEPPKKIRITASEVTTTVSSVPPTVVSSSDEGDKDETAMGDKKTVKLSELSMKERLEMRAKKFGAPLDPTLLKISRAERFGLSTGNGEVETKKNSKITVTNDVPSIEILKKRRERFGVVSTQMAKLEAEEKLQKRKLKFGGGGGGSGTGTNESTTTPEVVHSKDEYAEKARKRLERFSATKTEVK